MEVILSQDYEKLGKAGDVVKVKDGFARNFLLPRKIAYLATVANVKKIEQERLNRLAEEEKKRHEAEVLATRLSRVSCNVSVEVNDLERLYGSVTESDIAKVLLQEGYSIDRDAILLEKPINELGIYEVGIRLHPEVTAKIRLWVTKK